MIGVHIWWLPKMDAMAHVREDCTGVLEGAVKGLEFWGRYL